MDDERVGKARWKARNGMPSPQEEGERQRESARRGFGARIVEVYAILEAMLEAKEITRPQADAEEMDLPHETIRDR